MMFLFIEYVPYILIGAAGLIAAVVAIDFSVSRLKRISTRLAKISRGTTIKDSGRGLIGKPAPLGSSSLEPEQKAVIGSDEPKPELHENVIECDLSSDRQEATSAERHDLAIIPAQGSERVDLISNSERYSSGAPTERSEPVPASSDTERCEPVPVCGIVQSVLPFEPTPESRRAAILGVGNMGKVPATDSRSLVALATDELKQARRQRNAGTTKAPLGDEILAKRDPSVRIVDSVLAGSDRRVPL